MADIKAKPGCIEAEILVECSMMDRSSISDVLMTRSRSVAIGLNWEKSKPHSTIWSPFKHHCAWLTQMRIMRHAWCLISCCPSPISIVSARMSTMKTPERRSGNHSMMKPIVALTQASEILTSRAGTAHIHGLPFHLAKWQFGKAIPLIAFKSCIRGDCLKLDVELACSCGSFSVHWNPTSAQICPLKRLTSFNPRSDRKISNTPHSHMVSQMISASFPNKHLTLQSSIRSFNIFQASSI